jgi:hypothetical protein
MREKKYSRECAEEVVASLGLPAEMIAECMGDPEADVDNDVLKTEQIVQVGQGNRGDVTILPTLVINNVQYRGTNSIRVSCKIPPPYMVLNLWIKQLISELKQMLLIIAFS